MTFLNTPNVITMSRIILIPLIIAVYYVPDDWISYQGKNGSFYFPIATCILLSVVLTLILWLVQWLRK